MKASGLIAAATLAILGLVWSSRTNIPDRKASRESIDRSSNRHSPRSFSNISAHPASPSADSSRTRGPKPGFFPAPPASPAPLSSPGHSPLSEPDPSIMAGPERAALTALVFSGKSPGPHPLLAASRPGRGFHQPAVWMDLPETANIPAPHSSSLQAAADELVEKIAAPGLDPSSPAYLDKWNEAVIDSDRRFRQMHGSRAWMSHHIAAFHQFENPVQAGP